MIMSIPGIIIGMLWYYLGIKSIYFWFTREFKVYQDDFNFLCIVALMGPFCWITGWSNFRDKYDILGREK